MNTDKHQRQNLPIAITMGDPAGIGPDITSLAWQQRSVRQLPKFCVVSDPQVIEERAAQIGQRIPIKIISHISETDEVFRSALPVLPIDLIAPGQPGKPDPLAAPAICKPIEIAVDLIYRDEALAIVTNPINKAVLYREGFPYAGHTEFLGALSAARGDAPYPVMMLVGGDLRVVPATIHLPLKDVPNTLTQERLEQIIDVMVHDLKRRFSISSPRIAVTGLNPHAGEGGTMGTEETTIIEPAIKASKKKGYIVSGPYPADTIFHDSARSTYDAVLAMYHDQALIPVKTLAFDFGVNVTLGLPFIRTSPDHGTAYSIAGTGNANPASLIEAITIAHALARADSRLDK